MSRCKERQAIGSRERRMLCATLHREYRNICLEKDKNMSLCRSIFVFSLLAGLLLCNGTATAKESTVAEKPDAAICYHGSSGFILEAPEGWKNDADIAEQLGICMMLIPAALNFDDAPVIMYPKTTARVTGEDPVEHQVNFVLVRMRKRPGGEAVVTRPGPDISSKSGLLFTTRYFDQGPFPNRFELAAYCLTEDTLFFVVLSARTEEEREAGIPALRELLSDIALLQVELAPK